MRLRINGSCEHYNARITEGADYGQESTAVIVVTTANQTAHVYTDSNASRVVAGRTTLSGYLID